MKKCAIKSLLLATCIIMNFGITGCGKKEVAEETYLTPDDIENVYYLTEEELPNDMAYIVRTSTEQISDKKGNVTEQEVTKYYPIYYNIEKNHDKPSGVMGESPNRIEWVNYNIDEGYIPTMYPGDKLIYKSATYIPTKYSLEKFFDNGYTLGVGGLTQDLSGNYRYYNEDNKSFVMTTSDAVGFASLEGINSIYLVAVGDSRVTPLNVSDSGMITGLELMQKYPCDIRTGTERIDATLTCNIHAFSSAETYWFGSFSFITPHIAQLNVPDYVETGYYNLNNIGFFRYIKEEDTDYHDLDFEDYNKTIYVYNEDGKVVGTTLGLVFDENGFLFATGSVDENLKITNMTSLTPDKNGYFTGTYKFTSVSDPITSGNSFIYVIDGVNKDNGEHLMFKYTRLPGEGEIKVGDEFVVMFMEPKDGFDGYIVSYMTNVSKTEDNQEQVETNEDATESTEDSTESTETETEIETESSENKN